MLVVYQSLTLILEDRLDLFTGGMYVAKCMYVRMYTCIWSYVAITLSSHCSFYDVVLGIEDPDVFVPPNECRQ